MDRDISRKQNEKKKAGVTLSDNIDFKPRLSEETKKANTY